MTNDPLALSNFGKEAVEAVPALIQNLHYETTSDVREAAAIALGRLGPDARSAVPDLIGVLQNDNSVNVRSAAAEALGQIGDPLAVPALISVLYEEEVMGRTNMELTIDSAVSIALITGESFPDADSQHGYRLNEEGVPLVVIAAREWWEKEGQHRDWDSP
jgi:HEAT repeat protein